MIRHLFLLFIVFFYPNLSFSFSSLDCESEKKFYLDTAKEVKRALEAEALRDKIPVISYSVFDETCFLFSDQIGGETSQNSIFRIASVSKIFTSLAISQLVEKGILSLDSNLLDIKQVKFVQYLKSHETPERLEKWNKIKIRHLLTHQAGISKDLPGSLAFSNSESLTHHSYPTNEEFYKGLTSVEFIYNPGQIPTGFKYSNLGMNLLALIVQDMNSEQLDFSGHVKRNIFTPLSMYSTFYDVPVGVRFRMVQGFGSLLPDSSRTEVPKAYFVGSYHGAIGVATTAMDLSKLGQELLRMVRSQTSQLLFHQPLVRDFLSLQSPVSPSIGWAHGISWQTLANEKTKNNLWLGHSGTGPSERSILLISPEKNLGIVILFNVADANREKYVKIIADFFDKDSSMNKESSEIVHAAKEFLERTPEPPQAAPSPWPISGDLKKYEGTYFADIAGYQKVSLDDEGHLILYGQKLVVIDPVKGLFRFPPIYGLGGALFNGESVVFSLDKAGVPVAMRLANVKIFIRK
jgi:CubicO group peptidase (beta-lactamase class C family)